MVRRERRWVLPEDEAARHSRFSLKASDLLYSYVMNVPIGFVYKRVHLDARVMEEALVQTLNVFPIVAGRYRVRKDKKTGRIDHYMTLERSRGVVFDIVSGSKLETPESRPGLGTKSWDPFMVGGFSFPTYHMPWPMEPPLRVKLTLLANGDSVLMMSFMHCITDGDAIVHFLNTWSHLCGVVAGSSNPMPPERPPDPVLDREYDFDEEKLNEIASTKKLWKDENGPLTRLQMVRLIAIQVPTRYTDAIHDYVLDVEDAKRLKQQVSEQLSEGEWVSTYEVLVAMLLKATAVADHGENRAKDVTTRCLVNARARGNVCPRYYFGNCLAHVQYVMPKEAQQGQNWLTEMALVVHNELRTKLEDPDYLDRVHYIYEHGVRHLNAGNGILGGVKWSKAFAVNILARKSVSNSWLGYDWFVNDFGCGLRPSLMRVDKEFGFRRHMFIAPRSESTILIRMQFPPSKMAKFERAIKTLGLPLTPLAD